MTEHADQKLPRGLWVCMFLLAMSVLLIEVALTRIFSVMTWYHFTYLIIALALLGFGAAGSHLAVGRGYRHAGLDADVLARAAWRFCIASILSVMVATRIRLDLQDIHTHRDFSQLVSLLLIYVVVGAPFYFGGICIGYIISRAKSHINRLYFADLTGAGLGALLGLLLINMLGAVETVFVAGALAGLVAVIIARSTSRPWRVGLLATLACAVSLTAVQVRTEFIPVYFPASKLGRLGMESLFHEWHVIARVDVTPPTGSMKRPSFGGALSPAYEGAFPDHLGVWQDGAAFTGLLKLEQDPAEMPVFGYYMQGVPYVIRPEAEALVIGVGGGVDLAIALHYGAERVVGVDVSPTMLDLLEDRYLDYSGRLAERENVELVNAEGRHYLTLGDHEFDVIQLSGVDTFTALSTGAYALAENHLYTKEAMFAFIDSLSEDGIVSFSRWLFDPPRETLRLAATQLAALRDRGVAEPHRHFFIVSDASSDRERPWADVMMKKTPFTEEEVRRLRDWAADRHFTIEYDPFTPGDNEFDAVLRSTPESFAAFLDDYMYNVSPCTDDSPFFFQYYKWSRLAGFKAGQGGYGFMRIPLGLLVLIFTALQVLVMSLLLICWPLLRKGAPIGRLRGKFPVLIYFASLGLGFILIEMILIQKLTIFVGGPVYSMGVMLSSILVFSGVGSYLGKRIGDDRLKLRLAGVIVGICVLAVLELGFVNYVVPRLMGLSHAARCVVAALAVLPIALLMGMPFPSGIRIVGRVGEPLIPWAWAVNACATVLGTIVAVGLNMTFGFSMALLAGIAVYLIGLAAIQFAPVGSAEPSPKLEAVPA